MKRLLFIFAVIFALACTVSADIETDCAAVARTMRTELGEKFIVEAEPPFVVAGNLSAGKFDRLRKRTVKQGYDALERQFFRKRPTRPIRVYLFANAESYSAGVVKLRGKPPHTPFGFCRTSRKGELALIMNIATGSGTLVHEMFHALVEPDFPQILTWCNEGMASLFEQCRFTDKGLKGLVNWRLPVLKKGLAAGRLVDLKKLVTLDGRAFYRDQRGMHYAEARYFCMYMQEKGVLEKFYHRYRDNFKKDKTGRKSIEQLFGKNIDEVQTDWLAWVKTLNR